MSIFKMSKQMKQILIISITTFFILLLFYLNRTANNDLSYSETDLENGSIEVHFIDVGEGDATLIDLGDEHILIDGGNPGSGTLEYIEKEGITNLDLVVGTHPDQDHIGGLIEVIDNINIEEIWDSGVTNTSNTYKNYISSISSKMIPIVNVRIGFEKWFKNGAVMEVLYPNILDKSNANNNSIVIKLKYGVTDFLFMGDVANKAENYLISKYDLNSEVLKVGHHGSKYSSSLPFLMNVSPEIAVISVGHNSYGHPDSGVLQNLYDLGTKVYRTDLNGDIILNSDGNTISVDENIH